jgi:hypothetical protein
MNQEKRNRLLLVTLLVISAATFGYYWISTNNSETVDSAIFQVDDWNSIDRIQLERNQQLVDIRFDGIRWYVNDLQADRNMIDVLFATLQQVKPVRPVARVIRDSTRQLLMEQGVKVTLFASENRVMTFFAGGNSRKTQAYLMKEGEEIPYLVAIPGYRVYVSGIFELDGNGWRDKYVFQMNWRNFQGLSAQFLQSPQHNFDVAFFDTYFSIEGMSDADTTKLNDYLDAVSLLTVDTYSADTVELNSLMKTIPDLVLTARDVGGKSYSLSLYLKTDADGQIAGVINQSQLAIFNRKKIEPLLKKRSDFQVSK